MQRKKGIKNKFSARIDDAMNEKDVANVLRNKFCSVLNEVDDSKCKKEFMSKIQLANRPVVETVSLVEICMFASGSDESKCLTVDGVPNAVYKFADARLHKILAKFYSSMLIYIYIPNSLSAIEITNMLKNSLKDPTTSNNYRPVSICSTGSKSLEKIVLRTIFEYLGSTDHQIVFKHGLSNVSCVFGLKEVINYYRHLNSCAFTCFLDIKSSFDRVSFCKFFS